MGLYDEMKKAEEAKSFEEMMKTAKGVFATFEKKGNGIQTSIRVNASGQEVEGLIMSLISATVKREKAECDKECTKDGTTCNDPHTVITYLTQLGAKMMLQEAMGGGEQ